MNIALWMVQIVLALVFVRAGGEYIHESNTTMKWWKNRTTV